jgi:hypothetical protein
MDSWQGFCFVEGFSDINFNFVVSDFEVCEGRGWDIKPQKQIDSQSLEIAVIIEPYDADVGSEIAEVNLNRLIRDGKRIQKLSDRVQMRISVFAEGDSISCQRRPLPSR